MCERKQCSWRVPGDLHTKNKTDLSAQDYHQATSTSLSGDGIIFKGGPGRRYRSYPLQQPVNVADYDVVPFALIS